MLWGVVSASGKKEKEPTHLRGDSFFVRAIFLFIPLLSSPSVYGYWRLSILPEGHTVLCSSTESATGG